MSTRLSCIVRSSAWLAWLVPLLVGGCALAGATSEDPNLRRDQGEVLGTSGLAGLEAGVEADAGAQPSTMVDARVPMPDASGGSDGPDTSTGGDAAVAEDGGMQGGGSPLDAGEDASEPVEMPEAGADAASPVTDARVDPVPEVDAGLPVEEPNDLGKGNGSDVVTIGDSWMSTLVLGAGGGIEGALDRAGTRYRHHGEALVLLLEDNLAGSAIPRQWEQAVESDANIKTVIMTGGGADVYGDSACGSEAGCPQLFAAIVESLTALWTDMARAGVRDVVYVAYSADVGSGVTAEVEANGIAGACRNAPLRCHLLETTEIVRGELTPDGVVPTGGASDRIAEALLALLRDNGARR